FSLHVTTTSEIYTLSLHDALPIYDEGGEGGVVVVVGVDAVALIFDEVFGFLGLADVVEEGADAGEQGVGADGGGGVFGELGDDEGRSEERRVGKECRSRRWACY